MSISAFTGPVLAFSDPNNPETGPSPFIEGTALLDPRPFFTYNPGQNFGAVTAGFAASTMLMTMNVVPAAASAAVIAAAANVTSGTAMVLVSTSGSGITVGTSVVNPLTGATVTGLLAIDGASDRISFGSAATIQLWDPTSLSARNVSITGVTGGAGGAFLVSGYDIYGFPMSESITAAAGAGVAYGKKAFKYIASIVPQFTDAHNYSAGIGTSIGFPLASTYFGDVLMNNAAALIASGGTYTAAVTTVATTTTGDVRGTYLPATAFNGTNQFIVYQTPLLANLALANGPGGTSVTGLFGVAQT